MSGRDILYRVMSHLRSSLALSQTPERKYTLREAFYLLQDLAIRFDEL